MVFCCCFIAIIQFLLDLNYLGILQLYIFIFIFSCPSEIHIGSVWRCVWIQLENESNKTTYIFIRVCIAIGVRTHEFLVFLCYFHWNSAFHIHITTLERPNVLVWMKGVLSLLKVAKLKENHKIFTYFLCEQHFPFTQSFDSLLTIYYSTAFNCHEYICIQCSMRMNRVNA